jgi:hypothetical protein
MLVGFAVMQAVQVRRITKERDCACLTPQYLLIWGRVSGTAIKAPLAKITRRSATLRTYPELDQGERGHPLSPSSTSFARTASK